MATRSNDYMPLLIMGGVLAAAWLFSDDDPPVTPPPTPPVLPPGHNAPPTYTQQNFRDFADQLYQHFWAYAGEDEEAIIRTIARMNNDADVQNLIQYFGAPFRPASLRSFTLPQAVSRYLEPLEIADLNSRLILKFINYRF